MNHNPIKGGSYQVRNGQLLTEAEAKAADDAAALQRKSPKSNKPASKSTPKPSRGKRTK